VGKTRGYHLSALYAPVGWMSWGQIADQFVKVHENPEQYRVFVNTVLGEVWTSKGEAPDWQALMRRRDTYATGTVPEGVLFLTAACDVQKDRIVFEVIGWGRGKRSWSIDYGILAGDTADLEHGPWPDVDALLARTFPHVASGVRLPIRMLAVDSGFSTQTVYAWSRQYPISRVIAVKGHAHGGLLIGAPTPVEVTIRGRKLKRGARVWPVATNIAKSELYGWLRLERDPSTGETAAGFCHFPDYDEEYFKQLTAEQLVAHRSRKGFIRLEWEIVPGRQNHVLDARVYARAAAALVGLDRFQESDWLAHERIVMPPAKEPSVPAPGHPPTTPPRPRWLPPRPRGWLKARS
jgi:phage terminase large subunit GpA-like protein